MKMLYIGISYHQTGHMNDNKVKEKVTDLSLYFAYLERNAIMCIFVLDLCMD